MLARAEGQAGLEDDVDGGWVGRLLPAGYDPEARAGLDWPVLGLNGGLPGGIGGGEKRRKGERKGVQG